MVRMVPGTGIEKLFACERGYRASHRARHHGEARIHRGPLLAVQVREKRVALRVSGPSKMRGHAEAGHVIVALIEVTPYSYLRVHQRGETLERVPLLQVRSRRELAQLHRQLQ